MSKLLKFPFPRKFREMDKLTITRGRRDMILDYIEVKQLKYAGTRYEQELQDIHSMVFGFCVEADK